MRRSHDVGDHFEQFIEAQIEACRYTSEVSGEVVREELPLSEQQAVSSNGLKESWVGRK